MRKSLEQELRELEARDPAVAEAARKYDAVVKGMLSRTEIPLSEVSRVLRGFLIEMNALEENLTATQARCTELLEENRLLRRRVEETLDGESIAAKECKRCGFESCACLGGPR